MLVLYSYHYAISLSSRCFDLLYVYFSIDGRQTEKMGKFVNDSPARFANCIPKILMVDDKPHVAFFALKKILRGTELRYDYGGFVPWRKVIFPQSDKYMSLVLE